MAGFIESAAGISLYYTSSGEGRQTVLVPLAAWTGDFDVLARGRRVVRYDPRGRGRSSAIQVEQSSFDNDLADLDVLREALALDRVALIGWSYFGGVVLRYAMLHPECVERVVWVGGPPAWRAGWVEQMQREFGERMAAMPPDVKERQEEARRGEDRRVKLRSMQEVFRHTRMGRDPVRPFPDSLADSPNETLANVMPRVMRAMESMGDWDWRADAAKLQVPVLIVEGSADLCTEASREWAKLLPNAKILWMDGVGHFPSFEDPERFFPAVDQFLSE